jgi:hypothetical protein
MDSVETNAGTAIWAAPSRIDRRSGFFMAMLRWTFSISTVASSTRMPTASAMPPSVIVLSDCPRTHRIMMDVRIDSGIEVATIRVLRHEPRNNRIIRAVSPAAIAPSLSTPVTAARTKTDWSNRGSSLSSGGSWAWMAGRAARTRLTTSRVEAPSPLRTVMRIARRPSRRTTLVCTA